MLKKTSKAIQTVIVSGGLDSAVVLSLVAKKFSPKSILAVRVGFDSRQSRKESQAFGFLCDYYGIPQDNRSEASLSLPWLGGHALVAPKVVMLNEKGHRKITNDKKDFPAFIVPARNLAFLSIVSSLMLSKGSRDLWCGFDYGKGKTNRKAAAPALDKSPEFVRAFEDVTHAMWNGGRVKVHTPLMKNTKVDTVKTGLKLGTPFDLTWTCYNSLDMACGVCSSCKDRLEAFKTIGIEDPAPYVTDEHFLKYYKYPIY